MLVSNGADTGSGRSHDRVVRCKDLGKTLDKGQSLLLVSGVDMHLAAAGLLGREFNDLAQPLQHPNRRLSHLGKHGIGEAGDEQRGFHGHLVTSVSAVDTPLWGRSLPPVRATRKARPVGVRPPVPGSAHYRWR